MASIPGTSSENTGPSLAKDRTERHLGGVLPIRAIRWPQVILFAVSLALFMLALELMKAGTRGVASVINHLLHVDDPLSGIGFGWLSSYLVLSGSPVAAIALTLLDVGTVGPHTAFSIIVGSRVGGSLVVVLVGLAYMIRGHQKGTSLLVGILALIITVSVYVVAWPLGMAALNASLGAVRVDLPAQAGVASLVDVVYGPPVELVARKLPAWSVFLLGVAATVLSLNLIDRTMPELDLEGHVFGRVSRLLYRPVISFVLGMVLTLLTMSVSVSLGLLVPLSVRGYIRRENLVPYIMGCNISTFVDTLIAGILLRNPVATDVVLTQMICILAVSIVVLVFVYRTYERLALGAAVWLNRRRDRMLVFFALILLTPVALLLVGRP